MFLFLLKQRCCVWRWREFATRCVALIQNKHSCVLCNFPSLSLSETRIDNISLCLLCAYHEYLEYIPAGMLNTEYHFHMFYSLFRGENDQNIRSTITINHNCSLAWNSLPTDLKSRDNISLKSFVKRWLDFHISDYQMIVRTKTVIAAQTK